MKGYGEKGAYVWGHVLRWVTFVNGELLCEVRIMAGFFLRGDLMFTLDEHFLEHPYISDCAKFEQNWTIHSQVIAI